jgi:hypothetical protein
MNKYNHWLAKWLKKYNNEDSYAITIKQTIYYSESEEFVDRFPSWRIHENQHRLQWAREGIFKFVVKYLWYQFHNGYQDNKYEVEARLAAKLNKNF